MAKLKEVKKLESFLPLFLNGDAFSVYDELSETSKDSSEKIEQALLNAFAQNRYSASGSGSGLYSGGSLWSIVLRCDDHTGIFTCDGCARDPYFYVPAETQSYVIKLSCSRKVLAASGD